MNKVLPVIIIGGVVVVGLGIGGWYFFFKGGQAPQVPGTPTEGGREVQAPQEGQSFTGKLRDALTLGQSMKCTWRQDENNFGTAYIKNEKIRTDVTTDGESAHSIMADNCTYAWEEGTTEGFKMCFEPAELEEMEEVPEVEVGEEAMPEGDSYQTPDIDYTCEPAVVSDSMFNPPSGVQFVSPQELMSP